MKRILLAILVLSVATICYAADEGEEITLTTYYPAPYGDYDELLVSGNTYLAVDSGNVGIGTANPQGVLDLQSTTGAFLPPRMTEAERDDISSPPAGSVIYNIDDNELNYHNGTNWGSIVGGSSGGSLGDTVLKGSIAISEGIGSDLSFVTDSSGFITIIGLVSGGGTGWPELKIDGVIFGAGGIWADFHRNFFARPYSCITIPVGNGKSCTVTKRNHVNLGVDVYWTPLGV